MNMEDQNAVLDAADSAQADTTSLADVLAVAKEARRILPSASNPLKARVLKTGYRSSGFSSQGVLTQPGQLSFDFSR